MPPREMAGDVLDIFGELAVDITRKIEIELVLLDFGQGYETGVVRFVDLPGENIDDLMDVLRT